MNKITLTQGKLTIVDDEDYEFLNQWKWHYGGKGYAVRTIYTGSRTNGTRKGIKIMMHRIIMKTPVGMETDHRNGNTLDNRKVNLRNCTRIQNRWNNKSKGYSWHKGDKKYQVTITINKQSKYLGSFKTKEEAINIYKKAAKQYFGEYART